MKTALRLMSGVVAVIAAMLFMVGCTTVDYTGRSQLMFYNESDDISTGTEAWEQILAEETVDADSVYRANLERVGGHVADIANRPQYQWEFKVIQSDVANAFALPGGKVAFYTPIFDYMDNDAELATVVSHEVAHALARHGMERQSQGVMQVLGMIPILLLIDDEEDAQTMAAVYMGVTNVGAMLPYSRAHESEADHIGLMMMAKAGYDPRAAVSFWEKFGNMNTTFLEDFLSTHPAGKDRVESMRKLMPEALELYNQAPVQRGLGASIPHGK